MSKNNGGPAFPGESDQEMGMNDLIQKGGKP
jgi:hypothetical protein